jgi:LmbE family N-acetylglucosaminyl deacetylase
MTVDVLAIFAHPDDLELSVAGTLLKLKSLGYKTGALDVTQGEMERAEQLNFAPKKPSKQVE